MKFEDLKEFTYIDNIVIIDGVERTIKSTLAKNISAVQYHRNSKILEEPLMTIVSNNKYQYAINEWISAGITPTPTQEDIKNLRILEIDTRLQKIDLESIRPLRAISKNINSSSDIEKLERLNAEADTLRAERDKLA